MIEHLYNDRYMPWFTRRDFVRSFVASLVLMFASLAVNVLAGQYATAQAGNAVNDLVLNVIPVYDVSSAFIYGAIFLWIFVLGLVAAQPHKIPFLLKAVSLFVLIRSLFVSLTHLGPFPSRIAMPPGSLMDIFAFGGDLFFSGHTGAPFLLALIFWDSLRLRTTFIAVSLFFAAIVLVGHVHYSIDVLATFFITYSIYRLAEVLFARDLHVFRHERAVFSSAPQAPPRSDERRRSDRRWFAPGPILDHPSWSLDELERNSHLRSAAFAMPARGRDVKYPIRALRYWFMYHLIKREYLLQRRPLEVCEVGVGDGQMLLFTRGAFRSSRPPARTWDAVDVRIDKPLLRAIGYTRCVEKNVEDPDFSLTRKYDVIIALHLLEHVHHPESVFSELAAGLKSGGIIIGGSPVIPRWLVRFRELQLRRSAATFGHVSAFSPSRMRAIAVACGLLPELISGAFCIRSTGSRLENSIAWTRFNLRFGALFPWWPGELYWSFRKSPRK